MRSEVRATSVGNTILKELVKHMQTGSETLARHRTEPEKEKIRKKDSRGPDGPGQQKKEQEMWNLRAKAGL